VVKRGMSDQSIVQVVGSENESAEACSSPDTSKHPAQSCKDGHLTFSGWLLAVECCATSQAQFFAGKSLPLVNKGKERMHQWRQAGFPDLGEWPSDETDLFHWVWVALEKALKDFEPQTAKIGETLLGETSRLGHHLKTESSLDHAYESQVKIPLLTLVALIQSETFGGQTIENLAGTNPLARQLKALSDLWQSLGCPNNLFWRSTCVFYNRIADADDSQKA
jgi:hypothetical protein